jgi:hypothetical protein
MNPAAVYSVVVGFLDDDDEASFDVGLDLEAASNGLVMVIATLLTANECCPSLDVALNLQAASHRLVVVHATLWDSEATGFDIGLDFHTYHYSIRMLTLNIERRRHTLGFEGEVRRSPGKAGMGGRIHHRQEIYF